MKVARSCVLAFAFWPGALHAPSASAQSEAAPPPESVPPATPPAAPPSEPAPPAPSEQAPAPAPAVLVEPPANPEPPPARPEPPPVVIPSPAAPGRAFPQRQVPEPQQDRGATVPARRGTARGNFALELDAGLNVRVGGASGFRDEESVGGAYAAALYWNAAEAVAIGLELQHADLGKGSVQSQVNLVNAEFSATTAWLAGRFVPFRSAAFEGFVTLRAGLALQHVDAHGVRQRGGLLEPAQGFSCNELDGPDLAFGGGVGARFGIAPRLWLVTRFDGNAHRLSSERVGSCAAGGGSATSVGLGVGLAYEFGGSDSARAAASARTAQTW